MHVAKAVCSKLTIVETAAPVYYDCALSVALYVVLLLVMRVKINGCITKHDTLI